MKVIVVIVFSNTFLGKNLYTNELVAIKLVSCFFVCNPVLFISGCLFAMHWNPFHSKANGN